MLSWESPLRTIYFIFTNFATLRYLAFLCSDKFDICFLFYLSFIHVIFVPQGFKLVMKLELKGVEGFSSFSIGSRQYLLFTSKEAPSVFEIVKQSA